MTMTTKASRKSGRSRLQIEARRREREIVRALGTDVRNQRLDSGVSQAALSRQAEISQGEVSRIESGQATATIRTLSALSVAMGGRLIVRIEPGTGMLIRDHLQARILEALLRELDPRWKRFIEVPVYRPVRGVIDLVLHDGGLRSAAREAGPGATCRLPPPRAAVNRHDARTGQ
jgi:transcriptional regulator with XRE-family HTH domain